MTLITRRYHFSASHRLHVDHLSDAENEELFGKCNNPYGHGHNYTLSVTVTGEVDPETGLIVNVGRLDDMVNETVVRVFSHRNMNLDLPYFANAVPTTENVVETIAALLEGQWARWFETRMVRLAKVHVQETERNGFELELGTRNVRRVSRFRNESVIVNG